MYNEQNNERLPKTEVPQEAQREEQREEQREAQSPVRKRKLSGVGIAAIVLFVVNCIVFTVVSVFWGSLLFTITAPKTPGESFGAGISLIVLLPVGIIGLGANSFTNLVGIILSSITIRKNRILGVVLLILQIVFLVAAIFFFVLFLLLGNGNAAA